MSDIPEEIMKEAEKTLDLMLCNCKEAGDVRQDSIMDIARALLSAEARGMERAAKIADRTVNDNQCKNKFHSGGRTAAVLIAMRIRKEASDA